MLILSRKAGETLVIDSEIRIKVLSTDGRTVRLGIEAPPEVRVLRAEIIESVEKETRLAAETAAQWIAAPDASLPAPAKPRLAQRVSNVQAKES